MAVTAVPNTMSTLNGLFKITYDKELKNAVPNWAKVQRDIPFSSTYRMGEFFRCPVILKMEHGVTYAATAAGAFALNNPIAAVMKKADLYGSQIVLRATMDYESAFSGENQTQAFKNATGTVVMNMWESIRKRVELEMLYGRVGLGTVNTKASNTKLTISAATWADGIWAGMEGAKIKVYKTGLASQRLATGTTIAKVDIANRQIHLAAAHASAAQYDKIFFDKQYNFTGTAWNSALGIRGILNTSATTIFGITVASYSVWKPVSVSAGSTALTFAKVQDAIAECTGKGMDSDVNLYCNPQTWADLAGDQAALRRYDASNNTSRYVVGAEELVYHSQNGKITVISHPMVKAGEAFLISPKLFRRVGATDVTFNRANMGGSVQAEPTFFKEMDGYAGFELRCYSHQALFCEAPGRSALITGIVNA